MGIVLVVARHGFVVRVVLLGVVVAVLKVIVEDFERAGTHWIDARVQ